MPVVVGKFPEANVENVLFFFLNSVIPPTSATLGELYLDVAGASVLEVAPDRRNPECFERTTQCG